MLGAAERLQPEQAMAWESTTRTEDVMTEMEEPETSAVTLRQPTQTKRQTCLPSPHPLPHRLRISPKLRALEIPP